MAIQTKLRRWGNSFGIVIPTEIMKKNSLEEGEEVIIEIEKKDSLLNLFGSLRKWKINPQKVKNEIRKEEDG